MIAKTKTAVAALAAYASGALTHPSTTALVHAGPGFHIALSHRRRVRVMHQRLPGVRHYAGPKVN
jgi:ABC-type antimicrobial peptide transport system ATPase subunit